jgi:hypothetical protein
MSANMKSAVAAWGDAMPQWVAVLAQECDQSSQSAVAAKLKRSAPLVNQVLKNKYKGDLQTTADCVLGVFSNGTIACPELGNIPSNKCHEWRKKARKFSSANHLRVQMYRACRNCPLNAKET